MKSLLFSHHARDRMDERRVTQKQVYATLKDPDDKRPSDKTPGRLIVEKQLGERYTLRVIYTEENDMYVIISVIKMSRKRRTGRWKSSTT